MQQLHKSGGNGGEAAVKVEATGNDTKKKAENYGRNNVEVRKWQCNCGCCFAKGDSTAFKHPTSVFLIARVIVFLCPLLIIF